MLGFLWSAFRCLTGWRSNKGSACERAGVTAGDERPPKAAQGSGGSQLLTANSGTCHVESHDAELASVGSEPSATGIKHADVDVKTQFFDSGPAAELAPAANPPSPQPAPAAPSAIERTASMDQDTAEPEAPTPRRPTVAEPQALPPTPIPQLTPIPQQRTLQLTSLPQQPATERPVLKDSSNAGQAAQSPTPFKGFATPADGENYATPGHDSEAETPSAPGTLPFRRYMVDSGKVVGVANTVARYHEAKPLMPRDTPFNVRVLREMELEERLLNPEEAEA